MQAAGDRVSAAPELAARVQHREHDLQGRPLLHRMRAHRDAASVVGHPHATVGQDRHIDPVGHSGQCLVDGVVHDLLDQVVQTPLARGTDVHAGPLAYGVEPVQDGDRGGVVRGRPGVAVLLGAGDIGGGSAGSGHNALFSGTANRAPARHGARVVGSLDGNVSRAGRRGPSGPAGPGAGRATRRLPGYRSLNMHVGREVLWVPLSSPPAPPIDPLRLFGAKTPESGARGLPGCSACRVTEAFSVLTLRGRPRLPLAGRRPLTGALQRRADLPPSTGARRNEDGRASREDSNQEPQRSGCGGEGGPRLSEEFCRRHIDAVTRFPGAPCRRPAHCRRPHRRGVSRGDRLRGHLPAAPRQRAGPAVRRRAQRRLRPNPHGGRRRRLPFVRPGCVRLPGSGDWSRRSGHSGPRRADGPAGPGSLADPCAPTARRPA